MRNVLLVYNFAMVLLSTYCFMEVGNLSVFILSLPNSYRPKGAISCQEIINFSSVFRNFYKIILQRQYFTSFIHLLLFIQTRYCNSKIRTNLTMFFSLGLLDGLLVIHLAVRRQIIQIRLEHSGYVHQLLYFILILAHYLLHFILFYAHLSTGYIVFFTLFYFQLTRVQGTLSSTLYSIFNSPEYRVFCFH